MEGCRKVRKDLSALTHEIDQSQPMKIKCTPEDCERGQEELVEYVVQWASRSGLYNNQEIPIDTEGRSQFGSVSNRFYYESKSPGSIIRDANDDIQRPPNSPHAVPGGLEPIRNLPRQTGGAR